MIKNLIRTTIAIRAAFCSGRQPLNRFKFTIERIVNIIGILTHIYVFAEIAFHLWLWLTIAWILVFGVFGSNFLLDFGNVFNGDALCHIFDGI
jgi:hypothetical protein